jgi:hypothetical protein
MPIEFTAPPPKNTSNTASSPVRHATPKVTAEREEAVAQLGMFAQVPLIATKQLADAATIGIHWPKVSHELAVLAETQEPIANIIDPLMKVGPYAALIATLLPMAMQIAVNHGRLKPGSMGTVPAVSLSSQIETEMAKQEIAALRLQQEAEAGARQARFEMEQAKAALTRTESADVSA